MAEKRDYYEVLGVDKNASETELKKAYRKLAKEHHPDMNSGNKDSEMKFKEINEAYEVLGDAQKKAKYDQYGHSGIDPNFGSGFHNSGFGGFGADIFESVFSGFGNNVNNSRKGENLNTTVEINFEDAISDINQEITFDRFEVCNSCQGSGAKDEASISTCKHCNGKGQIQIVKNMPFGQFTSVQPCNVCHGKGKTILNFCKSCNGQGKVKKNMKINVKIPAGINDGQTILLKGEGNPSINGSAGDLYIQIRIKPHDLFIRDNNDIHCTIPITFVQATLGADIEVLTLYGKEKINISEGTQVNTILRLSGKGFPIIGRNGKGDQYIKIIVEIPKNLSEQQKNLLREFEK